MNLSLHQISSFTSGKLHGNPDLRVEKIYIDSRNSIATDGVLFVAINGRQHDSHNFLQDVYNQGCRMFLVEKLPNIKYDNAHFIVVDDSISALQNIAKNFRHTFSYPILSITGSNGKTIVKEWIYFLLSEDFSIVRSPKSYNSQIGVPLSVCLMSDNYNLGIFEAGISEPGEMQRLEAVLKPTYGLFTNIGNAHQEFFSSSDEKIAEKCKLFVNCTSVVCCADHGGIINQFRKQNSSSSLFTWSIKNRDSDVYIKDIVKNNGFTEISFVTKFVDDTVKIPYVDDASIENAINSLAFVLLLHKFSNSIKSRFLQLPQVAMRLELKEGRRNSIIINDSYNSDLESFKIALDFLNQQTQNDNKIVILSDIQQSGMPLVFLHECIFRILREKKISKFYGIGPNFFKCNKSFSNEGSFFFSTDHFIKNINKIDFSNSTILVKGARMFQFERICSLLEFHLHKTVLEVNLNALNQNLNYFKSLLNPKTKITIMVKAFSYGSGSVEVAKLLQHNRVDYLAVAFADEGIELRNAGIVLPIIVMNPEPETFNAIIEHNLEPEIYSFRLLELFVKAVEQQFVTSSYPVHIKFDTGMARMGFSPDESLALIQLLIHNQKRIKIASVFSHLAGSDEPGFDSYTKQQIAVFDKISREFDDKFSYPIIKHLLNSAGIERFPEAQYDMVRLGIGLYGVSAVHNPQVKNISVLKTIISQLRNVDSSQTIGYSRSGKVVRPSSIAVIPIGYADGLNRRFSNGIGHVIVNNTIVPIIGNICMDATMIDVTGINVSEGDEVVVFNDILTVSDQAKKIGTIPYEILTSISRRVKRVYLND